MELDLLGKNEGTIPNILKLSNSDQQQNLYCTVTRTIEIN